MKTANFPIKPGGPSLLVCVATLLLAPAPMTAQQIYKWTDASGQVHYSTIKPENVGPVQTLNVAPSPPAAATSPDAAAEIARLNALAEQMASERQAAEQARREQAARDLERRNQELQNELLRRQLEQQREETRERIITGYPPYLPLYPPYPPYPPYRPYPPYPHPPKAGPPCQPWPACRHPGPPPPPPSRPGPLAKPNPPFQPAPAGIAPQPQAVFRGR